MPVRTLPIRVRPHVGESLDSFLEALAGRSLAAWGDLLDAVDLCGTNHPRGTDTPNWLVALTPTQQTNLSQATGVAPSMLVAMTLSHGLSVLDGPAGFRPPAPVYLSPSRSRFCPRCLEETGGRWQLSWRFRWTFACTLHRCLLADICPVCDRWQRIGPLPRNLVPAPGRCARTAVGRHDRSLQRCDADLSLATPLQLAHGHIGLLVQLSINSLLTAASINFGIYSHSPVSAHQFLADLSAIGTRVLRYATIDHLSGLVPSDLLLECRGELVTADSTSSDRRTTAISTTSAAAAAAAVVAVRALREPTVAAAGKRLAWLAAASRGAGISVTNIGWSRHGSEQLLGAVLSATAPQLQPSDQLRYQCAAHLPCRPQPAGDRQRHVPSALWPGARLRFAQPGISFEQLGSALSAALIVVGTRVNLSEAASALGSVTSRSAVSRILQALRTSVRWPCILLALTRLAELLDEGACPIDYYSRRALPFECFLALDEWREICKHTGVLAGRGAKLPLVRCWMFERVTGSPARIAPGALDTAEFRSKVKTLPLVLPQQVVDRLDQSARFFLGRFGLDGEPLIWQPPDLLFEESGLQCPRPRIGPIEIQQLSRRGDLSLSEVAAVAGVSLHHVRHLLEPASHTTA